MIPEPPGFQERTDSHEETDPDEKCAILRKPGGLLKEMGKRKEDAKGRNENQRGPKYHVTYLLIALEREYKGDEGSDSEQAGED